MTTARGRFKKRRAVPGLASPEITRGRLYMYALIETGGKQYKVQEGDTLYVELLYKEPGETVEINSVLAVEKDGKLLVGTPVVDGAKVTLKVERHGKGPKVIIFKYKAKKNYRRKTGHRQPFTQVTVEKIEA